MRLPSLPLPSRCCTARRRAAAGPAVLLATVLLAAGLIALPAWLPAGGQGTMISVANAKALGQLFAARGFGVNLAGTKLAAEPVAVPRILLATLPGDLAAETPGDRKALFVRAVLPLVLTVNEEIAATRAQLVALAAERAAGAAPSGEQRDWLAAVARDYGVELDSGPGGDSGDDLGDDLDRLLRRVDVVPPSLALAQAALESGWGTSRFALEGNALFGQRTWGEDGLMEIGAPEGTRHRARSFARLLDGVAAYMRNLNSHDAYAEFRRARAALRAAGEPPTGLELVGHLTRYSELGKDYTRAVRGLIRSNGFAAFDGAELEESGDSA